MKKTIVLLSFISTALISQAQISQGGFPWSAQARVLNTPLHQFDMPEKSTMVEQERVDLGLQNESYVALFATTNINFPESGTFTFLDNGDRIWSTQVKIPNALGLGFYFEKFQLAKGVQMFIKNANGKHILGAYTAQNHNEFENFATEALQGELATLELNIPQAANEAEIQLNLDRVAVYFNSISHLVKYKDNYNENVYFIDENDSNYYGGSSVCNINAICPLGSNYHLQKKASLQQLIASRWAVFSCSGTMINSAANTPDNCKPYYLTASHCERTGSLQNSTFSQILLRFNYETAVCSSSTIAIPESKTLVGARLLARSYVNSNAPGTINGDFMLLEPLEAIPASWDINLSGWNNSSDIPRTEVSPKRFMNFSHPNGDVKKVAASNFVYSMNIGGNGSHWQTTYAHNEGIIEGGSSGSGLYNGQGYLIGIASTAGPDNVDPSCSYAHRGGSVASGAYNFVNYAKFSNSWDYQADGNTDNRKLKPWLDPNNTGVVTVPIVTSSCAAIQDQNVSVSESILMDNNISIYPNPVTSGSVQVAFNFVEPQNLQIAVMDVNGKTVYGGAVSNVSNGTTTIDLNQVANGVYMVCFRNGQSLVTKKIIVNK